MNINRSSFDHRFGDDLFELILSYLPIEDKIKYESVSKRFQRYIFDRQRILIIDMTANTSADTLEYRKLVTNFSVNVSNLRSLLKKFRFITTIDVRIKWIENMTDIVNTIANNCHHLTAINFNFKEIKPKILKKFCQKFRQQLKHISFEFNHFCQNEELLKDLLHLAPNLMSISNLNISLIDNKILSKKLFKIKDLIVYNTDRDKLVSLSSKSLSNLKYLKINIEIVSKLNVNSIEVLSQLKNLKVLEIFTEHSSCDSDIWVETIKSIASNCLHLEYFSFECSSKSKFNPKQCFESLIHFSRLKKLCFISLSKIIDKKREKLNLKSLKNCRQLLSLDLRMYGIDDETFEGIHLVVPQLRQLTFESHLMISDKAFESIGRLKYLSHMNITGVTTVAITSVGVQTLIKQCKRFKSFRTCHDVRFRVLREGIKIKDLKEEHKDIDFDILYSN